MVIILVIIGFVNSNFEFVNSVFTITIGSSLIVRMIDMHEFAYTL